MKIKGLDGRIHNWVPKGRKPNKPSSFHLRARNLLALLYPLEPRLEEVSLPGTVRQRADFFLPSKMLMVEAHGQQHYKFSLHMHGTRLGFLQSLQRDQNKQAWCELNGIRYVALPCSESDAQWQTRIEDSRTADN